MQCTPKVFVQVGSISDSMPKLRADYTVLAKEANWKSAIDLLSPLLLHTEQGNLALDAGPGNASEAL